MKKPLQLIMITLVSCTAFAQGNFTIMGKVPVFMNNQVVYAIQSFGRRMPELRDSVRIINGRFTLQSATPAPGIVQLYLRMYDSANKKVTAGYRKLFVQGGDQFILAQPEEHNFYNLFESAKITGGTLNPQWQELEKAQLPATKPYDSLIRLNGKDIGHAFDTASRVARFKAMESLDKKKKELTSQFIAKHPDYYVGLFAFREQLGVRPENPVYEKERYDHFTDELKDSKLGRQTDSLILAAGKIRIGQIAPDFTSLTPQGTTFKLSSMQGKYVLLDFWASWCGPCRAENPNVVKAYNTYKDKNFDILSVSLDKEGQKDKWVEAIKKDGMPWHHVSELKWWDGKITKQYMIGFIPQNYLLDPAGKIIAVNLRGEALQDTLKKLLN